ncbi:hypothetical protein [Microbacterium sp. SSM24]|uniref:hypothetical protein n=1 Tax=Microbacterium sp. SSM24 TaxID=2991714 RepID=UPI0022265B17|nr:hypothetical protein [Microbacterium sp. SSM24]MCW3493260.1 hypothetical protein [Microbacterium sp. SSM24]
MTWFAEPRRWESGPWSLELRDDELADLRFDGRVVLRSIRSVVRDRDWGTAPLAVDRVVESDATLTLHVRSIGLGSSFRGVVRAEARPGRLVVFTDLESDAAFATNRTGLVVLHPPSVAGSRLRVTHPDGASEATAFPAAISPHQPVRGIAGLEWEHDGLAVSAAFDGDVFEMEDQRNWTDASFKTYSRPLSLPFPYTVAARGRVRQAVTLRASRTSREREADAALATISLSPGGTFPAIGLGAATGPDPAPEVPAVGGSVLVELDLASPNWRAALARAGAAGLPLDVRLLLDAERPEALDDAVAALAPVRPARVGVFHQIGEARHVSDAAAVTALRGALARAGIDVPVVGGSRAHFTELNRERHRLPDDLDGVAVTLTPLFHALGTEQLVESIAMQRLVAAQTVGFAGALPVHIGPISLRPRYNDVAAEPQPGPVRDDLADGYGAEFTGSDDPRQSAPELAAWTVASAAALAVPGVASVTWFEEWGARGIRSSDGEPYPVAHAIEALSRLAGGELLTGDSPDGELWALGARRDGRTTVLVANLGRTDADVEVVAAGAAWTAAVPAGSFVEFRD